MSTILLAGTGAWDNDQDKDWFCPGHPFGEFLVQHGVKPLYYSETLPFIWSTNLSGVPIFTRRNKTDWSAGGAALAYFTKAHGELKPNIIAHSHGLQVALYACAVYGLKIRSLVSVTSPVRKDMCGLAAQARPHIDHWTHIHSDWSDKWQWFGELFDGKLGIIREHALADRNVKIPAVGHSGLLRDPKHFHLWLDFNLLDTLHA